MPYTLNEAYLKLSNVGINTIDILEFNGMNPQSKLKCKTCGNVWNGRLSSIIGHVKDDKHSVGCPKCAGVEKSKRNSTRYAAIFNERMKNSPTLRALTPYVAAKKPINMHCNVCGEDFTTTPDALAGHKPGRDNSKFRCPVCSAKSNPGNQRTESNFEQRFNDKFKGKFSYVKGTYHKAHELAKFICNSCGNSFYREPANFMSKMSDCPYCGNMGTMTQEMVDKKIGSLYNGEYQVVGTYKDTHSPVRVKHITCGETWSVRGDVLLRGLCGCPFCNSKSEGEDTVRGVLDSFGIPYEYQKKFSWCRDKQELPFDFYLPSYSSIIEIDGKQHLKRNDFFDEGKYGFEYRERHDTYKNGCAQEHGISVVRIPYDGVPENLVGPVKKLLSCLST